MLLTALQEHLAMLYETPIAHSVMDYLVTDARVAHTLAADDATKDHDNQERLLLRQNVDDLEITLYIDDSILDALTTCDPYKHLDERNLNPFLVALEGVSHFQYLVWNAEHSKQVTQLEMELQAEVDKYVTASMFFDVQGSGPGNAAFHESMFNAVSFADGPEMETGQRYRAANHFAGKYCQRLSHRYPAQHREPSFINELRRFYRLPQNEKIRLIEKRGS